MESPPVLSAPLVVVLIAALLASITDVWKFKVYNLLTLPLLLAGLLYHTALSGANGIGTSAVGMMFGLGVLLPLYIVGGVGAGDVKFLAAVGAWLGAPTTLLAFLAGSIATGVYATTLILLHGNARELLVNFRVGCHRLVALGRHLGAEDRIEKEVNRHDRRRRLIPFTAMMTLGLIATILWWNYRQ